MLSSLFLFIAISTLVAFSGVYINFLCNPSQFKIIKKNTYESGESPTGDARGIITAHFFVMALFFILFEVEILMLFPLGIIINSITVLTVRSIILTEFTLFILILGLGLAYVWKKGYLTWVKPARQPVIFVSPVPEERYNQINKMKTSAIETKIKKS